MEIDMNTLISVISVCAAVFFGYNAFMRNNDSDTEDRASMNARVLTKLDMISDVLNEMKRDSQDLRNNVNHLNERVLILEQAIKPKAKD